MSRRAKTRAPLLYVYAAVQSLRRPTLGRLPAGVPSASAPTLVDLGRGAWLVVAGVPAAQYSAEAIDARLADLDWVGERAVGHEAVVERLAAKWPTLPMKLFTLFASEDRARSQLAGDLPRLERAFARVAGCAEWGVRVQFDELGARRRAQLDARNESRGSSGKAFLLAKKKVREVSQQVVRHAQGAADEVFDTLTALSRRSRRRAPGQAELGARILLEAAFLVPVRGQRRFEREVTLQARELAPAGYGVTLTGPWPAYHFVAEGA